MKWTKIAMLAGAVYLATLVVTFPAGHLYAWVAPKLQLVKLYQVQGTSWAGSAKTASVSGVQFENVRWRVHFLPLLLGRLQLGLSVDIGKQKVSASVGRSWTGHTYVHALQGLIAVKQILEMAKIPLVEAEGKIALNDISMGLSGETIRSAGGRLKWSDAKVTVMQTVELDEISAQLSEEKNALKALITSSSKSALDINGAFILRPNGQYSFTGKMAERKNFGLQQILGSRCRRGNDGKCAVSMEGQLPIKLL